MVFKAPAHPSTKLSMLPKAPTRPRAYVADGVQGSRTSKHQGADGARGFCNTNFLGFRWCPRLPHIKAPSFNGAQFSRTTKGLWCRWSKRLPHNQGPKVLEALVIKVEGPKRLVASVFTFQDGSLEHCQNGSPEHHREPNRW
ncbi:hypothetical protein GOBAR_DD09213 [Gossypium barbadense]|nr:hypothetical protein GOBAR_DD09213 [Gossypium barbadense]